MTPPPTSPLPRSSARPAGGRYSAWRLIAEGLRGQRGWGRAWAKAAPKPAYRVVIVGGGGHGLATAYYLATEFGIRDVAVLERGPIGLGNVGRNTTIIRSNYFLPDNIRFYEFSLKLWEGLEQSLNFNAMVSQRGTLNLFHTEAQRDLFTRRANQMRLLGVDALAVEPRGGAPPGAARRSGQRPLPGARWLPAAARRHGAARCGRLGLCARRIRAGVDIIEHCEVTGIRREGERITGVETTRGPIAAEIVCLAVAGHSSRLAAMAGLTLPIESHVLQAFVTEAIKPVLDVVLTYGAGTFLCQPVGQGRPGVRRRDRRLQHLRSARHAADGRGSGRGRRDAAAGARAPEGAAPVGRRHGHEHGRLADHLHDPARPGSSSTAAGATAASRPFPPAA